MYVYTELFHADLLYLISHWPRKGPVDLFLVQDVNKQIQSFTPMFTPTYFEDYNYFTICMKSCYIGRF